MSKWLKQLRSMFLGDDGCGENASVPPSGRSADFLRVTVRQGVINEIFDQVEKHERKRRGCETGGGLIGKLCHSKRSGWLMQVQGLLAPGPCAEYRPGYFGADRAFQQRCLRTHQERDRELSFLGDWHRHPLQMRYPSPGDHSTDRDNLAEAFNEEKQIGMVIETMPGFVDRIIIVNDCSKDLTAGIVREYIDKDHVKTVEIKNILNRISLTKYNRADFAVQELLNSELKYFTPSEVVNADPENSRIILSSSVSWFWVSIRTKS